MVNDSSRIIHLFTKDNNNKSDKIMNFHVFSPFSVRVRRDTPREREKTEEHMTRDR